MALCSDSLQGADHAAAPCRAYVGLWTGEAAKTVGSRQWKRWKRLSRVVGGLLTNAQPRLGQGFGI